MYEIHAYRKSVNIKVKVTLPISYMGKKCFNRIFLLVLYTNNHLKTLYWILYVSVWKDRNQFLQYSLNSFELYTMLLTVQGAHFWAVAPTNPLFHLQHSLACCPTDCSPDQHCVFSFDLCHQLMHPTDCSVGELVVAQWPDDQSVWHLAD